ncbi:MAG: hypothetical protein COW88_00885 [Candidatus Lloydbacteria bacterium CG22_combo_CG10-13_8_21_14_all_47_15]|uniref:Glycosyltransferase RgtA/B/C/D-like domain-containing protein n=1 Tax=Candidatus Lloydbacteria bacterium CG22_combo_CG10-13_8_21_14_all_47_15 TaxID=1974635 RepID=A0A2H0CV20_9BACT|nr:MAG: hypothetical protein COW88_00885 [Candidatus Lloydbacteria bacterium CG22_combo_CG10-13_8_21_14_all_47_15]
MNTQFFKEHRLAIVVAFIVGLIYIAPNIFFIVSLGDRYEDIPMLQTANDDYYISRIQEILDGHPAIGSQAFYEYKDAPPFAPAVGEMFYAIPSMVFGISPAHIVVASHFVFPLILFLLVYFLLLRLCGVSTEWNGKLNALAGALLVTLGYDLIDYRTVWSFVSGEAEPGGFLVWARIVNPIIGALFLFSFLLCVWRLVERTKQRVPAVGTLICGAMFFALMIGSYFFSWGMALSVSAMLLMLYLLRKEYTVAQKIGLMLFSGVLFAAPYWYVVWTARQSQWYDESLLRNGLFYTHYPLLNKLVLAALLVYVVLVGWQYIWWRRSRFAGEEHINENNSRASFFEEWHIFSFAFLLGALWVYSQQILTGQTVWPYHFVQYSIPLVIVSLMTLLYRVVRPRMFLVWVIGVWIAITASVAYGAYVQAFAFVNSYDTHAGFQEYAPLFDWLNAQEKDCAVLVSAEHDAKFLLDGYIPAFTHCNSYNSTWIFSLMPQERVSHNYFTRIFFNGATAGNIDEYLLEHIREARAYLFSNWKGLYHVPDFPDFSDTIVEYRVARVPEDYRQFLENGIRNELQKYRLDYIVSVGPLDEQIANTLGGPAVVFESNGMFVYTLGD